jgi:hypothetical protein
VPEGLVNVSFTTTLIAVINMRLSSVQYLGEGRISKTVQVQAVNRRNTKPLIIRARKSHLYGSWTSTVRSMFFVRFRLNRKFKNLLMETKK